MEEQKIEDTSVPTATVEEEVEEETPVTEESSETEEEAISEEEE